jgi:hypothetical protein
MTGMRFKARLARLEHAVSGRGCQGCRDRHWTVVVVEARQLPDGTGVAKAEEPTPCPLCGRRPEQIIRLVERIVESSAEALLSN